MHDDDLELVADCLADAPGAWARLLREHVDRLHGVLSRMLPSTDVDDVLQRVFVKLWEDGGRRLRGYAGRARLSTWLVTVARREALAARVRPAPVAPGDGPTTAAVVDLLAEAESRVALDRAIDRLSVRDQLLLRLVCLDGASYAQAARLLGARENSISPWLARARGRLRQELGVRIEAQAPSKG